MTEYSGPTTNTNVVPTSSSQEPIQAIVTALSSRITHLESLLAENQASTKQRILQLEQDLIKRDHLFSIRLYNSLSNDGSAVRVPEWAQGSFPFAEVASISYLRVMSEDTCTQAEKALGIERRGSHTERKRAIVNYLGVQMVILDISNVDE